MLPGGVWSSWVVGVFSKYRSYIGMCEVNMIDIMLFEQELTNFFRSIDSVNFAYLFGSIVRGDINELSDVDIAVMLDESYGVILASVSIKLDSHALISASATSLYASSTSATKFLRISGRFTSDLTKGSCGNFLINCLAS